MLIKNISLFLLASFLLITHLNKSYSQDLSSSLIDIANKKSLHKKEYWKILLHYDGKKSAIKGDNFFYAKDGDVNLQNELNQTIINFLKSDNLGEDHAICRFPARFKWIYEQLNVSRNIFPAPKCKNFNEFLSKTSADKVYISFASENVNNPISMMGHIFLKISGQVKKKEASHALGYFAANDNANILKFVFKAISVGTKGIYFLEPYEKKQSEYNDKEKRSVWNYELNFSQNQINNLMLHIWEMRNIILNYNFVKHNCGSALLYILYAADEALKAKIDKKFSVFDPPIDIVKIFENEGYIKKIELLQSENYKYRMIKGIFSASEEVLIKNLIKYNDFDLLKPLPDQKKSNILFAAKTILNYNYIDGKIKKDKYDQYVDFFAKSKELNKNLPQPILIYDVKNPLKKSFSSTFSLGYNSGGFDKNFVNFGLYPVYNDLQSNNSQYFNEFRLQILNIEGRFYNQEQKARFNNIDLISVKSIIPYDYMIGGLSGNLKLNLERENFTSKSGKVFPNFTTGIGAGINILNQNIIFYSLLNFGYSYFKNNDIYYSYPELGFIIKETSKAKLNFSYKKYFANRDYKYDEIFSLEQIFYIHQDFDMIFAYQKIKSDFNDDSQDDFRNISVNFKYHF
jgi:hypothetical protein